MTESRFALVPAGRGLPRYLSFDEVRHLISSASLVPSFLRFGTAERNRLLLETLWQTGCRVGEVVGGPIVRDGKVVGRYPGIRPGDLDKRQGAISVQVEKRQKPYWHKVKVEHWLVTELLAHSYENGIDSADRLFPLSKRQVQYVLRKVAVQAGITGKVSPHTLRHSYAMHLRNSGVHAFVMKQALGHASLSSTLLYGQASDDDVAVAKEKVIWS